MAASGITCIDYGVAARPLPGQTVSGDLHHVECYPGGVMVAVADGLGHGAEAAEASRICIETLKGRAGQPLPELVERCHEVLRHTRGVALSLATFNDVNGIMSWLGIGNVEGIFIRRRTDARPSTGCLPLRGGVVGARLPRLIVSSLIVERGDVLVFATDGIHPAFVDRLSGAGPVQAVADRIMAEYGRASDDALVIVARYRGAVR